MLVQVITDNHIQGSDDLSRSIEDGLQQELAHFAERITHVEVHLYDLNGPKAGEDKRCMMEARLAGLTSVTASHEADNLDEAIDGASEKLHRVIEHRLGRLNNPKGRATSFGGDQSF
jgi:ribosome-associated translation inhibitor RaiA